MAKRKAKKRNDGRFCSQLSMGDGTFKYFYSTESKADAERKKQEYMFSVMHPESITRQTLNRTTFLGWRNTWLNAYKSNLSENTKAQYRSISASIAKFELDGTPIGDMLLTEILPLHIAQYITALEGMSKSTIQATKLILSDIFSTAVDNGIIDRNPCTKMPKVNGTYTGHKALTREEISLITNYYDCHPKGLMFLFLLFTGCRKGEMVAVTWKDIDFNRDIIHIHASHDCKHDVTKGPKSAAGIRDIPLLPPLRKALYPIRKEDGLVFPMDDEQTYYTESALEYIIGSFLNTMSRAANGLPHPERGQGFRMDRWQANHPNQEWKQIVFNYHDLRSTYCTMLFDAGVPARTAQAYLGHSNVEITLNIYTKLSKEQKEESADKISAFVSSFENPVKNPVKSVF